MIYIHNATIFTPAGKITPGALIVVGETVLSVGHAYDLPCPPRAQLIDAQGMTLVPGFIDLQINGAFGMDFTANPASIWQVGALLPRFGVTAFLPTIVTSPDESVRQAISVMLKGPPPGYIGARALGLHLEGPFLNPEKRGAHNPDLLRLPDPEAIRQWIPENGVRLVTLAPELPGAIPVIQMLVRQGVVVSAGHSQATFNEAQAGFEAGIRYGTHMFNAMPALDHRQPGLVGALLADHRLTVGMIVDGVHIHPDVIALAWHSLGAQRANLVTDTMAAFGMPQGDYQLGGRSVFVDGSSARLADGRLAGSLLSLDHALRNLMAFTGCSLEDAMLTVTDVPARLLGLSHKLGSISPGAKADLVLLTPEMKVAHTWVNGQSVYQARD